MPIDMTLHKQYKYVLFFSLYFAEGLYQALILIVTPIYLIEKNIPIPLVTLISGIGYLPWGLKFVWGGIIDYFHKYGRKTFAIFGTIIGAVGFFTLSIVDQSFSIIIFAFFLLLGYSGIGFLDSATDAWAIDISKKQDRGKINCSMNIGKWMGQYVGALVIIFLAVMFGYSISFIMCGMIVLILAFFPYSVQYKERKIGELRIWSIIRQEFKKYTTRTTTFYFFTIVLQHALFFSFLLLYLKLILKFNDLSIGFLFALWLVVVIPGSLLGGILADKLGRKKPLYIFLFMMMISSMTPIVLSNIYLILFNFSLTIFFMNAVIPMNWAMVMDIINPKISAFEHEIICSIVNFGSIIIGAATGMLFVLIGGDNIFILTGIITLIAIAILFKVKGLDRMSWNT